MPSLRDGATITEVAYDAGFEPESGFRDAFGETRAYGELGPPRAVGRANAANPIAIVVPCHRVVAAGGRLTGYAGGLWRKPRLLAHEPAVATRTT